MVEVQLKVQVFYFQRVVQIQTLNSNNHKLSNNLEESCHQVPSINHQTLRDTPNTIHQFQLSNLQEPSPSNTRQII
jgi:hypothetical protein